jgi:hypothetical protein
MVAAASVIAHGQTPAPGAAPDTLRTLARKRARRLLNLGARAVNHGVDHELGLTLHMKMLPLAANDPCE